MFQHLLLAPLCLSFATVSFAAVDCSTLKQTNLPHTTITLAEQTPGGNFEPPYGPPVEKLPAFCRVAGVITPSSDSAIRFEVWLPSTEWNGKFMGVGNGGFAGSIDYSQLAANLKRGYATAATNTGHDGSGADGSWAYHHPEKIVDFGYRGLHETTVQSKALVQAFYGEAPKHAYFASCSNGGREALMEAQRFPADYDGILAGAPANNWVHMVVGGLTAAQSLGTPSGYISSTKLPAIAKAVLAACDASDGLKDGILDDPPQCRFAPKSMLCDGVETRTCLTASQVHSLEILYAGSHDAAGQLIFPGFAPGGELGAGGWGAWLVGESPDFSYGAGYQTNFLRYMVYDDPKFNVLTADLSRSLKAAMQKIAPNLDATDPDLSRFAARGGKLILYHGWNDPAISPFNSIAYFKGVESKLGAETASRFTSLYMIPGMQHCYGGPGASAFGQSNIPTVKGDQNGIETALEHWVEKAEAPGQIYATKYTGDNPGAQPMFTRPLCAYPEVPRYKGTGETNDASSFACVKP